MEKLSHFIYRIDSLEEYFFNPQELTVILHQYGVNVRYLGLAYDNLKEEYPKRMVMTEIAARVTKHLLKKTLQDIFY